ncbi:MAG: GTPase HflX [Xanthomonadales bacterium]|nr:GTPase HflX [Xanthomonadales bacterium]NIN60787.1 GTPase HflX [Xanthomonadales bacterium]NIN76149.1 GTPase HflX [Xanthomonadales bacterium]NIO15370.1 GTPase HflX [Xanthomonadales bacterium]NIP13180.1 GTPase HflX [Xanthomonadales bacterium]
MFERAGRGDRAVILHPVFADTGPDAIEEFKDLARSAGVEVAAVLTAPRDRPDPTFFVGRGKIDELTACIEQTDAGLVLVSRPLSAVQERNIERQCQCRVLDRTTLILDIFAQRARSYEGRLQVELAQLRHLSTRLVRGWTHLERQKGGIGLRGPGETQLETDRRLVGQRIRTLRSRLDKVGRQRAQSRRKRQRREVQTVALVGYTNAGKSTLFNALTRAEVDTRDMQFATLDPTVRQLVDHPDGKILLADTVGFVSELPPELIAAFRATLLETREADLLLHVIDASDPFHAERREEVEQVLETIGAGAIPAIRVYNKIDRTGQPAEVQRDADGQVARISVSALEGIGLEALGAAIDERLTGHRVDCWITVRGADARLRARLFDIGAVAEERVAPDGSWRLHIEMPRRAAERLAREPGAAGIMAREQLLAAPAPPGEAAAAKSGEHAVISR